MGNARKKAFFSFRRTSIISPLFFLTISGFLSFIPSYSFISLKVSYIGYYEGIHESCILMERLEGKDLFQVLMLNFKLKKIRISHLLQTTSIIIFNCIFMALLSNLHLKFFKLDVSKKNTLSNVHLNSFNRIQILTS